MRCANYMNFEAIRESVKKHEERWGSRDPKDRIPYDLGESNLIRNCLICDFGGTGSATLDGIARVVSDQGIRLSESLPESVRIIAIQDKIKQLSGEPMKRICFKEPVCSGS